MAKKKLQTNGIAEPLPSTGLGSCPVVEIEARVFEDSCGQLLDRVHAHGIELVVTKHGTPVARVIPSDNRPRTALGYMRGTVLRCDDLVPPDFELWGDLR